jgi:hypothetical protein
MTSLGRDIGEGLFDFEQQLSDADNAGIRVSGLIQVD